MKVNGATVGESDRLKYEADFLRREQEREKRSKIIHAEGEFSAAQRLVDAAHLLQTEPASIQLRYLQTLTEIGVEKNTTVIFPVPIDLLSGIQKLTGNIPQPAAPARDTAGKSEA